MSKEEWREIPGYPGYKATRDGKIMGPMGRVRKLFLTHKGYLSLPVWPMKKNLTVHKAVLLAYCGPKPSPRHQSRHLNGDRKDNRIENLRWGTPEENAQDAIRHGTFARGEKNGQAILTESDVRAIRGLSGSKSIAKIAKDFGVAKRTAWDVIQRRRWKHVK